MIKAVRGTRDLLPPDTGLWNFVEAKVREVMRAYNFQEIRTPIFESTELFARGVGEETDIVSKEMYTWDDRGRAESDKGQSLTLRPENTAGVVRAYIEHKLWDRGLNKLYYIGPQFRRERPQKGRYRQFYQIGAEVIGSSTAGSESPARDAEILEMLATLLDRLGIQNWKLQLNSVGCPADRERFNVALKAALAPVAAQMCADCQRRAVTNPLRVFDCKVPEDQPIIEKLPRISQFLDEDCRKHFEEVQSLLTAVGVPFTLNDRLVRGLDYYTATIFELKTTAGELGAQNTVCGGGRYDGLVQSLGGPKTPALGFALGVERTLLALAEPAESYEPGLGAFFAPMDEAALAFALPLAHKLRTGGQRVEIEHRAGSLKKVGAQLKRADKLKARLAIIVGGNEIASGKLTVKDLATGQQHEVPVAELEMKVRGLLD